MFILTANLEDRGCPTVAAAPTGLGGQMLAPSAAVWRVRQIETVTTACVSQ